MIISKNPQTSNYSTLKNQNISAINLRKKRGAEEKEKKDKKLNRNKEE